MRTDIPATEKAVGRVIGLALSVIVLALLVAGALAALGLVARAWSYVLAAF